MENIKTILKNNNFTFKKAFGQNFITDTNLLKSIVELSGIQKEDVVLEIGPGAGTLTREIAIASKKVVCYEIDKNLAPILNETLYGISNYEVFYQDIMKIPMEQIENNLKEKYIVVANLPYYITTPIIMKFIEKANNLKSLVIMVQQEVADRIVAKENTKEYGSITSAIRVVGDAKIIKKVPKTMFFPVPKVDSAVVKIDINKNKFELLNSITFKEVLHSAFNNRRKMLVNNLMQTFNFSRENAEKVLIKANVPLLARGETLSTDKFVEISNIIEKNYEK